MYSFRYWNKLYRLNTIYYIIYTETCQNQHNITIYCFGPDVVGCLLYAPAILYYLCHFLAHLTFSNIYVLSLRTWHSLLFTSFPCAPDILYNLRPFLSHLTFSIIYVLSFRTWHSLLFTSFPCAPDILYYLRPFLAHLTFSIFYVLSLRTWHSLLFTSFSWS